MATDRSCRRRRRAIAVDEDHEPRPPAGRVFLTHGCGTACARPESVGSREQQSGAPPRRRGRSSAGPARPAARPKPPLSSGRTLPSPFLFPRQFPLLAQSYLEEHQEHNCAKTDGDQRDGEHFADQPSDEGGADRTGDDKRRGRSKCQDARAGRHRPKVSLRPAAEQITVAGNESAASRAPHPPAMRSAGGRAILSA
jgi:hypothetical protein